MKGALILGQLGNGRKFNSTWSTMTSLWNKISAGRNKKIEIAASKSSTAESTATPSPNEQISTPWNISVSTPAAEPIKEFWIRTGLFRVSSQKLNLLGRQISQLTLSAALLQMKFSHKKAAREIHTLLLQAQARIKQFQTGEKDPNKFIIKQAMIGKGPYLKRIDIKGRGRHGVIWRPHSFLRLQVAIPDIDAALKKRFKVRIHKENKPIMTRLDY